MASKQFFDPLTLLRIAPVVSTSMSLWYCVDQYTFFNNFIIPPIREKGNQILPLYWKHFLSTGLTCIFSLYGLSIGFGVANLYQGANPSRYYSLGVAFSAAHFLFVPLVAPKIEAMSNGKDTDQNWDQQRRWLNVHAIRSVLVDLPGWACFLAAASQSLVVV